MSDIRVKLYVLLRKLKKLIKTPGIFLRDYLINKYPYINTELLVSEGDEPALIKYNLIHEGKIDNDALVVDVVFTWVNNADPEWQNKYKLAKQESSDNFSFFATDEARFMNHDELFYSVNAVKQFLPWVRKIFVLTDDQIPTWFKGDDQIEFVFHRNIINPQYLPTFNSHVIEAHLHLIPGLAEHFVYFNDDVFVARSLPKGHFFRSNGIASLFISDKLIEMSRAQLQKFHSPTTDASKNSKALLYEKYGINIENKLVHTYQPLLKSMFFLAWQDYYPEIQAFLGNKFRGDNDLNLATFFVPWLAYCKGKSVEHMDVCYYFNIRSPHAQMQYKKLLEKQKLGIAPHSFCANDFTVKIDSQPNYHKGFSKLLNEYYIESETIVET